MKKQILFLGLALAMFSCQKQSLDNGTSEVPTTEDGIQKDQECRGTPNFSDTPDGSGGVPLCNNGQECCCGVTISGLASPFKDAVDNNTLSTYLTPARILTLSKNGDTKMKGLLEKAKLGTKKIRYYPTNTGTRTAFMVGNANVSKTVYEGSIVCPN